MEIMSQAKSTALSGGADVRPASNTIPPWLLVLAAILSVQVGAAFAKGLFEAIGTSGVVLLRTLLGAIIFFALWRPRLRGYDRQTYLLIVLYGIDIAVMMLSFYAAIDRIPLGIAVAIAFAGPLGLAVIGSRRAVDVMWVALAGGGVILLSPITNAELDTLGVLLAVVDAVCWALYIVLTKAVGKRAPGNDTLAMAMGVAALVSLPFGAAGAVKVLTDPGLLLAGVLMALLSSAIPFWLEFKALKLLPPRVFGLLLSLEPVVAVLIGLLMLSEALGEKEIIGIGLVTVAAAATARSASEH
jgi:inner membrane transporter RhtA